MKDGLVLFYMKDNILYPVALDKEGYNMLQFIGNSITGGKPLRVLLDKPMGEAVNLIK